MSLLGLVRHMAEVERTWFRKVINGEDIPLVYGDHDRLVQVITNLLSNSVKFTPAAGTVRVGLEPGVTDSGAPAVVVRIADTGIGIPAADRPHLFRRFYRASTALDRRIPGTGLGLVITRAIIERHGGTIALASHDRPGTTFRISLPTKTVLAP